MPKREFDENMEMRKLENSFNGYLDVGKSNR